MKLGYKDGRTSKYGCNADSDDEFEKQSGNYWEEDFELYYNDAVKKGYNLAIKNCTNWYDISKEDYMKAIEETLKECIDEIRKVSQDMKFTQMSEKFTYALLLKLSYVVLEKNEEHDYSFLLDA